MYTTLKNKIENFIMPKAIQTSQEGVYILCLTC